MTNPSIGRRAAVVGLQIRIRIRNGRETHRTGRCNQARLRIRRVEHVRQQVASPFLWRAPVQTLRVLLLEAKINFSKVRN